MTTDNVLKDFQDRVDEVVSNCLTDYHPEKHAGEKSVRDAVWGTSRLHGWEVAILDSPLMQRLRDVRQTGLAFLVYPTALHTRFDHTLGMVTVASRIVRSVNDKYAGQKDPRVSYREHMLIRLSALLHDVGHSCFSHVSEVIYGASPEFKALLKHINRTHGVIPKPHEIMSWLVVRSEPFKRFIQELKDKGILTGWECASEDLDVVAGNIIGYRQNPTEKYLADIINGPMDADKLDYLVRDAYFAGPTVVYDLERFLQMVDTFPYPRDERLGGQGGRLVRLSIPIEGVTALEQIVISKLMLFSYLYHHQKIRCVEGMYHELLKRLCGLAAESPKAKRWPLLDHPVAFLNLSDRTLSPEDWPPDAKGDRVAGDIVSMLARRELYKRALVISRLFTHDINSDRKVNIGFQLVLDCGEDPVAHEALRTKIFEATLKVMEDRRHKQVTSDLRKAFRIHHVLLDVPKSPSVEETKSVMIPVSSDARHGDGEYVPLGEIFPIEKWVEAYSAIKWRGHVFTIEEAVPYVNAAACRVLASAPYNLRFTPQATKLCKIDEPVECERDLWE